LRVFHNLVPVLGCLQIAQYPLLVAAGRRENLINGPGLIAKSVAKRVARNRESGIGDGDLAKKPCSNEQQDAEWKISFHLDKVLALLKPRLATTIFVLKQCDNPCLLCKRHQVSVEFQPLKKRRKSVIETNRVLEQRLVFGTDGIQSEEQ
jgi:hypothetical protein